MSVNNFFTFIFFIFINNPVFANDTVPQEKIKVMAKKVIEKMQSYDPVSIALKQYNTNKKTYIDTKSISNRIYGHKNAENTVVVFSDFACGHCKHAAVDLKRRVDENRDKLNLIYILFPLDKECNPNIKGILSRYSCPAAKLALCAEKQGKFWEALALLYENTPSPGDTKFIKPLITKMEKRLKIKGLNSCLSSVWLKNKIKKENSIYSNLDIPGTPYIFLNGKKLSRIYTKKEDFTRFLSEVKTPDRTLN